MVLLMVAATIEAAAAIAQVMKSLVGAYRTTRASNSVVECFTVAQLRSFFNCTSLTQHLHIPVSVTEIGGDAFASSGYPSNECFGGR